ncbi:MAG TPA: group 1 glycosyl transferase [Polaromonas sp.]|nr:group 1 glycosyl transferase [Polaromonas sp.]
MAAQAALNLAARIPGIVGSYRADVTWLERNFIPNLDDLAGLLKHPIVLDIDDAIWLYSPFGESIIKRLVRRADMVFAGNSFIADWCSNYCKAVQIIPTAIDCDRFKPRMEARSRTAPFVVGWTGTSGNFRFLKMIEPALAKFLAANSDARLLVVADQKPCLASLPQSQLVFKPWQAETEHLVLHEMDVGVMPIDDSDISRGKCSFKMLQYMAAGLPVIVSPYGMNQQVLAEGKIGFRAVTIDDWFDALNLCLICRKDLPIMGSRGRNAVIVKYSVEVVAKSIVNGFGKVC